MVKTKRKRAPRTPRNMTRANRKMNPSEKIRRTKARLPSERTRRNYHYVTAYRNSRTPDELYRYYAISAASQKWRCIIRSKGKPKKTATVGRPSTHAFRPDNYDELLDLIPKCHRVKPTGLGQCAIYLPHDRRRCDSWTYAKVAGLSRHKESNWVLFKKPCVENDANPYVAIDSTNVFLKPPHDVTTALYPNRGVYLLYCPALNQFYVGESNNIAARIARHEKGTGAKVTRSWPSFERLPLITKRKTKESMKKWEYREWEANRLKYGFKNVHGACFSQEK